MLCCAFMLLLWLVPISVVAVEISLSQSHHNVGHTHTHTYMPKRTHAYAHHTIAHKEIRRLQRIQEMSTYQNMRKNLSYSQFEIIYFIAISSLLPSDLLFSHSSASASSTYYLHVCVLQIVPYHWCALIFRMATYIPMLSLFRND